MVYTLGLSVTIALCGWIALQQLAILRRARSSRALGAGAVLVAVWATGELLLGVAETPGERAFARGLLFAGACPLGPLSLWLCARVARPAWWRTPRRRWIVAAGGLSAGFYATIWLPGAPFVDPFAPEPGHGPLFPPFVVFGWLQCGLAAGYFLRALWRVRGLGASRKYGIALGVLLPFAGNGAYLLGWLGPTDPTPVLLGVATGLLCVSLLRWGVALDLPMARDEVIESLDVGILVANSEGRVRDANPAALALLGVEYAIGRPIEALLGELSRQRGRVVETRRFAIGSGRAPLGEAVILTDQSTRAAAERKLRLAARLEAVGHLTAGLAHEVNNPLAYVRANLSQLEELCYFFAQRPQAGLQPTSVRELAQAGPEIVAETLEGVHRIAHIVDRLRQLAHSRPGAGSAPAMPVDVTSVVERVVEVASAGLPVGAIRIEGGALPKVPGREEELVQIVLDLVVNALQATSDGLTPRVEIHLEESEGGVLVRIDDRGPGLPAEHMEHLFDPFFSTREPGVGSSGLGLSVSYDLARGHGGRLDAADRPGGGASFSLWLPTAEPDDQDEGPVLPAP